MYVGVALRRMLFEQYHNYFTHTTLLRGVDIPALYLLSLCILPDHHIDKYSDVYDEIQRKD